MASPDRHFQSPPRFLVSPVSHERAEPVSLLPVLEEPLFCFQLLPWMMASPDRHFQSPPRFLVSPVSPLPAPEQLSASLPPGGKPTSQQPKHHLEVLSSSSCEQTGIELRRFLYSAVQQVS